MTRAQTALVTGAAGFIGSHLVDRLLDDGVRVVGVDAFTTAYDPARKRENLAAAAARDGFRLVELDLAADDLATLPDVDVVFHLAAQAGVRDSWGADFDVYLRRNVLATQRLLERYRAAGLERFVYASSSSVYGAAERLPTPEDARPEPLSPYGVTKLAAEHLVLAYARAAGLPAVALRYFTVYGPRQRPDMAFHRFGRALLSGGEITVYGDGRQTRDFTYVADAVEATVRAWRRPAAGVYNVGGGRPTELMAAVQLLERRLGGPARVRHAAAAPGDPPATCADVRRLRAALEFTPAVPLEEGLAREADWLRGSAG